MKNLFQGIGRRILNNAGSVVNFDDNTRCGVIPHAHASSGSIHFHFEITGASNKIFLLVDSSDTTIWPHDVAGEVHVDEIDLETDPDTTAEYAINIYWLENIDDTDAEARMLWSTSATKKTGQSLRMFQKWSPNGPIGNSNHTITSMVNLADIRFNTGTGLPTVINPTGGSTAPGNYDLILEVVLTAGTFWLDLNFAYHTHGPDHV